MLMDEDRVGPSERKGQAPTEGELSEMADGARWAHEAAQRSYRSGGNQGEYTPNGAEGITDKYAVTDRKLVVEGEEGYPTPT